MKYRRGICWLRRDLRVQDHRALYEACAQCESVVVLFVFDRDILDQLQDKDDRRLTFIHSSLAEVEKKLTARGAGLIVRYGRPSEEVLAAVRDFNADAVFANQDYEPKAKKRDEDIESVLRAHNCHFHSYMDQVVFEKRELLTGSGGAYRKFTPYKNSWLAHLDPSRLKCWTPDLTKLIDPTKAHSLGPGSNRKTPLGTGNSNLKSLPLSAMGFQENALWLKPGSDAANRRLDNFEKVIRDYKVGRDFPAAEGTSGLSVHLRFGTISVRECVRRARQHKNPGGQTWLSELIWRDFYQMILDQYPHVVGHAFKENYETLIWPGSDVHFKKWCRGETGYPLVDAAMRHFNDTGWMHNRLRMIVAMFLTKDLLVDWKKGEAYFARYLLDFDLAANNGGWQWSASTGVDAQPYFRIFNPITQSEKFDPDGDFIKSIIPELKNENAKTIHWPHGRTRKEKTTTYCEPIVEHSVQRDKALELFRRSK